MPTLTLRQQQALIEALVKRVSPDIAKAFVAAINTASNQINVAALTAAIRAGNIGAIVQLIRTPQALLFPLDEAIRAAFMAGALSVADQLPLRNPFNGSKLVVAFDGHHPLAETWARNNGATLIEGILESQVASVRAVIADGIAINRSTSEMALDIVGRINRVTGKREGGILGLNASQTDTLIGARADLSSGEAWRLKHYLNLKSRDPSFDRIVEEAIRTGEKLPRDMIERILTKHKNKMLKSRGEMIARDQAYTAIDTGQHQGWQQFSNSGQVAPRDVTKRWQHNLNRPARPDHLDMSGTVVALDEAFQMPDGTRMQHTHDPAGGAKNNLNCYAPMTKIARLGLVYAMKHQHSGELVELSFGSQEPLTVTPNHPVLTRRGWVPAGEINEGEQLFQCGVTHLQRYAADVENVYAAAEEIYDAAELCGRSGRVSRGLVDFHGYIPDKDVDVVAIKGRLGFAFDTVRQKEIDDGIFAFADVTWGLLLASRIGKASGSKPAALGHRLLRRLGPLLSVLRCSQSRRSAQAVRVCETRQTAIIEACVNRGAAHSNLLGDRKGRKSFMVKMCDLWIEARALVAGDLFECGRFALTGHAVGRRDAEIGEAGSDDGFGQPSFAAYLQDALSDIGRLLDSGMKRLSPVGPMVDAIAVTGVRRFHYDGPVYNFESTSSVLVAGNIVTHNCHCTTFYRLRKGRDLGS